MKSLIRYEKLATIVLMIYVAMFVGAWIPMFFGITMPFIILGAVAVALNLSMLMGIVVWIKYFS